MRTDTVSCSYNIIFKFLFQLDRIIAEYIWRVKAHKSRNSNRPCSSTSQDWYCNHKHRWIIFVHFWRRGWWLVLQLQLSPSKYILYLFIYEHDPDCRLQNISSSDILYSSHPTRPRPPHTCRTVPLLWSLYLIHFQNLINVNAEHFWHSEKVFYYWQ